MNLLGRFAINAVGLWLAARFIDGITLSTEFTSLLLVALIFGLVNAIVRPVAVFLSLPALLLSFGLFILVVNAAMLAVTAWLTDSLTVDGFVPAVLGAVVISVISWVLSKLLPDNDRSHRAERSS